MRLTLRGSVEADRLNGLLNAELVLPIHTPRVGFRFRPGEHPCAHLGYAAVITDADRRSLPRPPAPSPLRDAVAHGAELDVLFSAETRYPAHNRNNLTAHVIILKCVEGT